MPAPSAEEVIRLLGLQPHPEGGHFVEMFRSPLAIISPAHEGVRAASTAIYFLLKAGELSALHRVGSDEAWHHYAGDTLELHTFKETGHTCYSLGSGVAHGERPQVMIPAGTWQAARVADATSTSHGYALCGCTVAPGFDFIDFEMPSREDMLSRLPGHPEWVRALTRP